MLAIRYLRTGKRNQAFFRIVLTESSKPAKSGFIKILGWYNPHTKEASFNEEEILKYLNFGAKPSNSVAKLLKDKVKHKAVNFIPDAPKAKKEKKGAEVRKPAAAPAEATEEVVNEETAEVPTEEIPEAPKPEEAEVPKTEEIQTDAPVTAKDEVKPVESFDGSTDSPQATQDASGEAEDKDETKLEK